MERKELENEQTRETEPRAKRLRQSATPAPGWGQGGKSALCFLLSRNQVRWEQEASSCGVFREGMFKALPGWGEEGRGVHAPVPPPTLPLNSTVHQIPPRRPLPPFSLLFSNKMGLEGSSIHSLPLSENCKHRTLLLRASGMRVTFSMSTINTAGPHYS